MARRAKFLAVILLVAFSLAGCGGDTTTQQGPQEEERATTESTGDTAKEPTARGATTTQETTQESTGVTMLMPDAQGVTQEEEEEAGEAPLPPEPGGNPGEDVRETPPVDVSCEEFGSQFGAQQFFDSSATPEQRAALDPEGDSFACSQGNPAARQAPEPIPVPQDPELPGTPAAPDVPPPDDVPDAPPAANGADCSTGVSEVPVIPGSKGDCDGDGIACEK